MNKQILHLTYSRAVNKIGLTDRPILLTAIEADHAAFISQVRPEFTGCFGSVEPRAGAAVESLQVFYFTQPLPRPA